MVVAHIMKKNVKKSNYKAENIDGVPMRKKDSIHERFWNDTKFFLKIGWEKKNATKTYVYYK